MLIKIWASVDSAFPKQGPYKLLDTIEKGALYSVGEMTHYGEVVLIASSVIDVARSRRDDQSDVTPTSHGIKIPPRFPKAASNPNIVAPP
jgi:hypothetical protein